MSVLGIDIGTSYCVLATIQRGAVTIIRNDLSERLTPALIGFTEKERQIGESAQTQIKSNYKNTCRNIKQLLGVTQLDTEDLETERQYALAPLDFADPSEGSLAGFNVTYKGKQQVFTATRCLAALLTKLRDTAERSIGGPVRDVVISCPAWFSDRARQAILDASDIAGLNCLRVMNEHAAVALDYGIYRTSTFDAEKASRVVFVGVGHGSTNVSVVDFTRGHLRVLGVVTDQTLGGRDFDVAIMKHFATKFSQKCGVNPLENQKAVLKLEDAATKMKKILSANSEAPCNIECLIEDHDLHGLLTRQEFEQLCLPFKERLVALIDAVFVDHGLQQEDVHHIEIVGGCTRTPWIQETILEYFKHRLPLSKTLSMDETVARGCALQAAMLDPRYRVREFNVGDCLFEPVSVAYLSASAASTEQPDGAMKTSVLFEKGSALGMKKWLTFNRTTDFEVHLTPGRHGHTLVSRVELPQEGLALEAPKRVKLGAKLSLHGTVGWDAAQLLVDEEIEEKAPEETEAPMETDGTAPSTEKPEEVKIAKKKTKTRRFECKIVSAPRPGYLEPAVKATLSKIELEMIKDDATQRLIKELMNDLETYIYKMQSMLTDGLKEFASPEELHMALQALSAAHEWVYDTPDGTLKCYENKLKEIQAICQPIVMRQTEAEERVYAIQELRQAIADLRACETSPEWAHVQPEKLQSLVTKVADASRWLDQVSTALQAQSTRQDPTTRAAMIRQEKEMLVNFSKTVLIPKPVVVEPPPTPPAQPSSEEKKTADGRQSTQETDNGDASMSSPDPASTGATENSDVPMS